MAGRPFNVVGENVTKRGLCDSIRAQVPSFIWHEADLAEDPDRRDYAVSADRIATTGFAPEWSLDRGIAELLRGCATLNARRFTNA